MYFTHKRTVRQKPLLNKLLKLNKNTFVAAIDVVCLKIKENELLSSYFCTNFVLSIRKIGILLTQN